MMKVLIPYLPVLITIVGIYVGIQQFKEQINRSIYERRLSNVYGPLKGLLHKQDLIRKWYPNLSSDEAPILELVHEKKSINIDFNEGKVSKAMEELKFLDRTKFSTSINKIDLGFARPKLIKLINEYDLIIEIQNKLSNSNELKEKADEDQVRIEKELVEEIISGYDETVMKIGIDKVNKDKKI